MNCEIIWNRIIDELNTSPIEISTVPSNCREPLWFKVFLDNGELYVNNAMNHKPSTNMSQKRKILKRDFENVCPYYQRWNNGELHLRQEVREESRNTAYIFALIAYFQDDKLDRR